MIRHRGPDDEGYTIMNSKKGEAVNYSGDDSIGIIKSKFKHINTADLSSADILFGHRRLSIIDLSPTGHCPMSDIEGKIWITYNGEIYNYIELRSELISLGFRFVTQTDTEVIINSYLMWGIDCLKKFNGMWAFALWDSTKKQLFAARDRFGVKPLYYYFDQETFSFCSEIKPLAKLFSEKTQLNAAKIPFYVLYGNRLNSNDTYLNGISSLQASHYLIYENNKIQVRRYYDVSSTGTVSTDADELKKEIYSLLLDSIKLRFRSDVPVGTCLSGGFDSSSIVALSENLKINRLNTFSAVWKEPECDESKYIDIVNEKFNCVPNKVIPSAIDFESDFKKLNYYQEIPSEGPGLFPQWFVMKKAKDKVKVLLDGQGGDEIFGGYFQLGTYLRSLVKDKKYSKILSEWGLYRDFFSEKGIHSLFGWVFPKQYSKLTKSLLSRKHRILNKDAYPDTNTSKPEFDFTPPVKFGEFLRDLSYHFLFNVTIPALLHYEDRSSMAHSIESRVPFLDYRIVEFGLNLKSEFLFNNGVSRPLFRDAMKPFLPTEVYQRKDKLGFPVPFDRWTRTILKDFVNDTLLSKDSKINEFVSSHALRMNIRNHLEGTMDYGWQIWRLLSLESILKLYSDRASLDKMN